MEPLNPTQDQLLEPNCVEDIEALLLDIWPSGEAQLTDFTQQLGITHETDINKLKSRVGLGHTAYSIKKYADYLWSNSNYGSKE